MAAEMLGPFKLSGAIFAVILIDDEIQVRLLKDPTNSLWETVLSPTTEATPTHLCQIDQDEEETISIYYHTMDGVVHKTMFHGLQ